MSEPGPSPHFADRANCGRDFSGALDPAAVSGHDRFGRSDRCDRWTADHAAVTVVSGSCGRGSPRSAFHRTRRRCWMAKGVKERSDGRCEVELDLEVIGAGGACAHPGTGLPRRPERERRPRRPRRDGLAGMGADPHVPNDPARIRRRERPPRCPQALPGSPCHRRSDGILGPRRRRHRPAPWLPARRRRPTSNRRKEGTIVTSVFGSAS